MRLAGPLERLVEGRLVDEIETKDLVRHELLLQHAVLVLLVGGDLGAFRLDERSKTFSWPPSLRSPSRRRSFPVPIVVHVGHDLVVPDELRVEASPSRPGTSSGP